MKKTILMTVAGLVCAAGATTASAQTLGPDIIVGDLLTPATYTGTGPINGFYAYAIGTTSCNVGDVNALWIDQSNQKPVIGQNLYQLKNNRFRQVGQSWLKHGFTALTQNLCGSCNGAGGSVLGVGCSDPYSASLNGTQGRLGPRFEVNAASGFYPWPGSRPATQNALSRRLQVAVADIETAAGGARYFAEGHYITRDDAVWLRPGSLLATNGLNNAGYREASFPTVLSAPTFNVGGPLGQTQRTKPALWAWRDVDPTVVISNVDTTERHPINTNASIATRFIAAGKVVNLGNGQWRYEYAVQNLNSDRSADQFSIPLPGNVNITGVGFWAPPYHSGEPYSNAPWVASVTSSAVTWSSPETFAQNPNTNALRWGTTYTFWFTANTAPQAINPAASIDMFKPATRVGEPDVLTVQLPGPSRGICVADCNADGIVDVNDFFCFLNFYSANDLRADVNNDGVVNINDFFGYLSLYSIGCPA